MKKLISIFFLLFQVLMAQETKEVTFSGGAPLDSYQPSIIVPILNEAFKQNHIKFKAKYLPSLRSLQASNSGKTDGELHRIYDFAKVSGGKYPNLIRIESKLLSVWLSAFSTKEISINSFEDLKNYQVAYYRGRKNVEKALNEILNPEQIKKVLTDEQALKMLSAGRVDIVVSQSRDAKRIISQNLSFSKIKEIGKLQETKIYAYINKKHSSIAPKIATTLEEMKKDGRFLEIINNVDNSK